jgi:hypothetical protein
LNAHNEKVKKQDNNKGKGKSTRFEDDGELEARYRVVVEEKKCMLACSKFHSQNNADVLVFYSSRGFDCHTSHTARATDLRIIVPSTTAQ